MKMINLFIKILFLFWWKWRESNPCPK